MRLKYSVGDYVSFTNYFKQQTEGLIVSAQPYYCAYYIRVKQSLIPGSNSVDYWVKGKDVK